MSAQDGHVDDTTAARSKTWRLVETRTVDILFADEVDSRRASDIFTSQHPADKMFVTSESMKRELLTGSDSEQS